MLLFIVTEKGTVGASYHIPSAPRRWYRPLSRCSIAPYILGAYDGFVFDIRVAGDGDVDAIVGFGADIVPSFYAPLIGQQASDAHFEAWWNLEDISQSVRDQEVVVATDGNKIVGVGQYGILGDEYVIWKLYVHPDYRGQGIGVRLINALINEFPADTPSVLIEHFAANERTGEFYEREGFFIRNIDLNAEGDHRADVVWRKKCLSGSRMAG